MACHTAEGPLIQGVFHAIDEFLSQHEQEVLVVELTHTYNGQDELSELASMISETVGHHMAPCCRCVLTPMLCADRKRTVCVQCG